MSPSKLPSIFNRFDCQTATWKGAICCLKDCHKEYEWHCQHCKKFKINQAQPKQVTDSLSLAEPQIILRKQE